MLPLNEGCLQGLENKFRPMQSLSFSCITICEIYTVVSSFLKTCVVSAGNSLQYPVDIKDLWEIRVIERDFVPSSSGLILPSFLSEREKCVPHCHYYKLIPAAKLCKFGMTQYVQGGL